MTTPKIVTDATFEAEVLGSARPVIVDFWAAWCGPCKMLAPEIERLAERYDGRVDIAKVDVDANPGLSQSFGIMSIPTVAFFEPGQQPKGVTGFRTAEALEAAFGLDRFLPGAA
jgi:thioredoxin 1